MDWMYDRSSVSAASEGEVNVLQTTDTRDVSVAFRRVFWVGVMAAANAADAWNIILQGLKSGFKMM